MKLLRGFLMAGGLIVPVLAVAAGLFAILTPGTTEIVSSLGGWPVIMTSAGALGLVIASVFIAVGAAPQMPPLAWSTLLAAHVERLEAASAGEKKATERRLADLAAAASDAKERFQAEAAARSALERDMRQLSAGIEQLPRELVQYYGNGVRVHGSDEVRAVARAITSPWRAVEGTMSVELLEPFFEQVQRVVKDREAANPVHHYSSLEVLRMFERISESWRKDEWFQKALRWMEHRYGSR